MGKTSDTIENCSSNAPVPDVYLVCTVDGVDFVQDGTRRDGEHCFKMKQQLRQRCAQSGARVVELRGNSWKARVEKAITIIDDLLSHKKGR